MRKGVTWGRLVLCLTLLMMLLAACTLVQAEESALPKNYRTIAENERFILGLDTSNCFFCVFDRALGQTYFSNPEDWKSDTQAVGSAKTKLRSQLVISVLRSETGNVETVNSYAGSVSKGNVKLLRYDDGLEIRYTFAEYGLTIPLHISLGADSFRIFVSASEIEESGEDKLLEIELTPLMAAAGAEDKGYILLPDGSGALMHFNNGKGSVGVYKAQVYGIDPAFSGTVDNNTALRAALPVMGMNYGHWGLLAVADAGDTHAYLNAAAAGAGNGYNTMSFSFSVRSKGEYTIGEENYNSRTINLFQQGISSAGDYSVTWYPLSAEESDYIGMAQRYGELLFGDKQSAREPPRLLLNLYGMIYKEKPVLGIPVNQAVALTSYADAQRMLEEAAAKGVRTTVQYLHFSNGTAQNKRAGIKTSNTLGGEGAWRALLAKAAELDTPIYAAENFLAFTSKNALISRFTSAAVQLSSFPVKLNRYLLSTHKSDASIAADYLLKAERIAQEAENTLRDYEALAAKASFGDAAKLLYSDFSQDDGQRDAIKTAVEALYAKAGGALESYPNAYALPYASLVCDVPFASSGFSCMDETVPFYAYVLRGHVSFATEAVNLSDMPAHMCLHAIETGADLAFALVKQNSEELQFSEYSNLYACDWSNWSDSAAEMYQALCMVRSRIDGLAIAARRNESGLVTVTYADGTKLLLNYSNGTWASEAGEIMPGAWKLLEPKAEGGEENAGE